MFLLNVSPFTLSETSTSPLHPKPWSHCFPAHSVDCVEHLYIVVMAGPRKCCMLSTWAGNYLCMVRHHNKDIKTAESENFICSTTNIIRKQNNEARRKHYLDCCLLPHSIHHFMYGSQLGWHIIIIQGACVMLQQDRVAYCKMSDVTGTIYVTLLSCTVHSMNVCIWSK
jgi:hypothetical protein